MAIKDNLQPFWGFNVQGITKDDGSANDAFISSLQSELDKTELDLYSSKLETYLDTAEGRWLDYWGRWLGLHRDNRSDNDYRTDLINHVLHERNTISAIKEALTNFLKINQDHIYIYEPWRDMFVWNASHYNTHKFFTDPYYRYAVIDIQIEGPYSEVVNGIINLFRPAGVYWVVTSLVNVINNTAPILDLSLPTTQIIESADTDYANFTQTNSAYLNSKLDLATYVGDPFNYNKDNLNAGKQYATSNSSYNPVVYIGSNEEEYDSTIETTSGGVNVAKQTDEFLESTNSYGASFIGGLPSEEWKQYEGKTLTFSITIEWKNWQTYGNNRVGWELAFHVGGNEIWDLDKAPHLWVSGQPNGSSGKKRLSTTITVPNNIDVDSITGQTAYIQSHADYFKISNLMVEEGTVAHAWSPNPSDSGYASWLQTKYQNELAITSQQLKQQLISENATIKTTSGGVNLLKGTSSDFQTAPSSSGKFVNGTLLNFSSNDLSMLVGSQVTARAFIHNTTAYTVNLLIWTDQGKFGVGTGVPAGTDGYSTITSYSVPSNATVGDISIRAYNDNAAISGVQYKEFKLEIGSVATPWSPNPSDSDYNSWLQTKYLEELAITQPALLSSIDSQAESFTVDQTQTSLLGGIDLLNYLTVYKQLVKPSNQTAKQFILANLANSNTQRLELVLQNQANIDLTQDVRLELYDYNLHLWVKPIIEYEVHSDYTIFKISLPSLAPYLSDGGNFMFQVWPTTPNITTLYVNYLGYLFNAPSDIIKLANSAETFTMETN